MPDQYDREEDIFRAAVRLRTPAERQTYIEQVCGDDPVLLSRLTSLLTAHGAEHALLDALMPEHDVSVDGSTVAEGPGTVIYRYKLLEKIGEGGMAVVYMAEQEQPIRRKVALKIIKLGMDTKQVIARFEAERQALAMMDHPNIAKVLDAGATETGRPYFVMEMVTGVSITEYCDKNNLSTRERLALFIQVCNAIQHAHQKGIIHRDLKPSNVLVTHHDGKPVPKVIDFGIAKATNQKLTERTLFTRYAHIIGTPAYMSPEQAELSDVDIDTRSDVYSLGVLLYELLAGTPPFSEEELRKAGYVEMQRVIREKEPAKPSTRLGTLGETLSDIARRRRSTPELLRKAIRGDLDWIVMKSLEKDRARRYETAHAIAEDVQRHLKHEPVLTASRGPAYHLWKFWRRHRSRLLTSAAAVVLLTISVVSVVSYLRGLDVQWARGEALPQIIKLIEQDDYLAAFSLAQKAERYIGDDPALAELWPYVSRNMSVETTPSGTDVFFKEYSDANGPWQYLGRSPVEKIRFPRGTYRWKFEKQRYETRHCVADHSLSIELREEDSLPRGMVQIRPGHFEVASISAAPFQRIAAPPYLMDIHEVTNEQFKESVDAGGYRNPDFWRSIRFAKDGLELSWAQAVHLFHDSTGHPGPAAWKEGTYPEGQQKHPVCGVSWYEAMAYAQFVGKSLPTVYHWQHAACLGASSVIVPFSNFRSEGTTPVGSHAGMGRTGLYDMAGNAREWCFNATDDSGAKRYVLGGSWGEPTYLFTERDHRSTWDRSPANGFRCVQYPQTEGPVPDVLLAPLEQAPTRDFSNVVPFSEEEFGGLKGQYEYDRTPLNARIEGITDGSPFWKKETITFDAAYGGERVIVHLFLPRNAEPPYQTVIYFPGVGAVHNKSFTGLPQRGITEYVIRSGRALLYPVYKGTYERPAIRGRVWTMASVMRTPLAYRDWTILMAKDLRRSIDYLETRQDIDTERMAYYGFSWGAALGPIMLAVEDRFRAGIFIVGGLSPFELPRPLDTALYAHRVRIPVLMINGTDDFLMPLETCQKPMYELLGTHEEHKKHKLYPGGHDLFRQFSKQIQADVLGWLNRYLAPVAKRRGDVN
jgi:serine/threonine protein kinase/formylglycine-generating enzyme required for sulfatase activity/dienelactone hydrolase